MSISDLMASLMMVFMFIAIVFMITTEKEKQAMRKIALTYEQSKTQLRTDLRSEFEEDLEKWGAEILDDGTFRFKEPDVLFARSSAQINQGFIDILNDFFPRYIKILTSEKFKPEIDEVRIEGHTSSLWRTDSTPEEAYLKNAELSQRRSRSVLQYVYMLPSIEQDRQWLSEVIRANGVSYAQRILRLDGTEDFARSRRVEFRVVTRAEEKIYTILGQSGKYR